MEFIEALHAAGIDFVATLAQSSMAEIQKALVKDGRFTVIRVSNEGEGVGICAGAWLTGKKPVLIMENTGLFLGSYQLLRLNAAYCIPTLLMLEYRGDKGDANWFAIPFGWSTEQTLQALRIPYTVVGDMAEVKTAITKMWKTSEQSKYPAAILLKYRMELK